ncbi:ERCC4 domain [Macleaya cordata]|uniref:ERCC4 domain n=1 Tax=Macleaya cordata TaxID=56857 RepID=A0A200PTD0_MACCD|nr:ERCC4 domain [Macleaya cordata]
MAQSLPLEILSDDDDPSPIKSKPKRRKSNEELIGPSVVILDDDPTPKKPNPTLSTPSFVPETPFSPYLTTKSDVSIIKCTAGFSDPKFESSSTVAADVADDKKSSGESLFFYHFPFSLESQSHFDGGPRWFTTSSATCENHVFAGSIESERSKEDKDMAAGFAAMKNLEINSSFLDSASSPWADDYVEVFRDRSMDGECSFGDAVHQVHSSHEEEKVMLEQEENSTMQKDKNVEVNAGKKSRKDEADERKRKMKEEKMRLIEERKQKREQEKLQKQALKAEAAEMKKLQKEQHKWENGKFALKSIVAEIDSKVVELGSIGGHVLTRFAEKGLTFRITSNPIERSILWTMAVPEQLSKLSSKGSEVPYILLVFEADEFCNLVNNESLMDDVSRVQSRYPSYTICYLTNRLKSYINKREQEQYKNPSNSTWRRPPVEEVVSKLTTDFARVHSRQCIDESELAEHVVGLTCSLATCQFRKKLTRLSINANGSLIPKDFVDKNLIKKNIWLKALVAIPKVQPRFAIAIWKKYPTMKSLLSVYMDPSKSVHEKEFLLKDLTMEGLLGKEDRRRRVGEICSKRVYRILMAQNGGIKTDDVEDGADLFRC